MKYGSVCSGIEAATAAWHGLGWKPAWFAEIEKFPSAVLAHHYPDVVNLGDMTKIQDSEVFNGSAIDVLVGGTPCQSFSVAGLRKGLADPRGNLALHFLALLDRKRPKWVVWENVPGVLSSWSDEAERPATAEDYARAGQEDPGDGRRGSVVDQRNDFDTFTCGLRELGYDLAWRVLDAQHFGVPQRRRRVFVIGHLGDWRRSAAVLFERDSLCGNPAPSRATGQGDPGGPQTGPGKCYRWQNEKEGLVEDEVTATLRARAGSTYPRNLPGYVEAAAPAVPILEAGARTGKSTTDPRAGIGIGADGDPMFTLQAGKQHAVTVQAPIAFSSKDHGADAGEISPTLRASGHDGSHANGGAPPAVFYERHDQDGRVKEITVAPTLGSTADNGCEIPLVHRPDVVYENHGQDSRVRECDVSPQINAKAGTGGGNLPLAITTAPVMFKPAHYTRGKDGGPSEICPPLTAEADKGDTDAIVFETRFARNGRGAPESICPPLKAQSGENGTGDAAPVVAFTQNSRSEVREIGGGVVGALAAEPGAQQQNYVTGTAVRRLTPRECERLQGFPDDFTKIPWGAHKKDCDTLIGAESGELGDDPIERDDMPCNCGKPPKDAPDGPRYKALGNSMAVVVMRWLGNRIAEVAALK